jgi:hypothetical protein
MAVQSCSNAADQGKQRSRTTLQKKHTLHIDPAYPFARASKPHNRATRAGKTPQTLIGTPAVKLSNKETDVLGPLTGHALRICFCQPFDGAGYQTADAPCMRKQPSSSKVGGTKGVVDEPETEPVARVVRPVPRKEKATRRVKSGAAAADGKKGSGSAVSTGMAVRVARVGA